MKTIATSSIIDSETQTTDLKEQLVRHYEQAGPDYEAWSKNFNMHFGFYRKGLNPFDLESLLEETNRQVLKRVVPNSEGVVLDLGCGLGATMRRGAKLYPQIKFEGITLVPWQIAEAKKLNSKIETKNLNYHHANYLELPFPDESVDGCYAIESAVYAPGPDKRKLFDEIYRVLKPGGRFVVQDCFLRQAPEKMTPWVRWAYRKLCKGWAVTESPQIELFLKALKESGFNCEECRDITWNVAPSVAHVPWATLKFLWQKLCKFEAFSKASRAHIASCLLCCVAGLALPSFSYHVVTGYKAKD